MMKDLNLCKLFSVFLKNPHQILMIKRHFAVSLKTTFGPIIFFYVVYTSLTAMNKVMKKYNKNAERVYMQYMKVPQNSNHDISSFVIRTISDQAL